MLQQTQTSRVLKKYPEFLRTFSTIHALACAPRHRVLKAWGELGYNRRALMLQQAAQIISKKYRGKIPRNNSALQKLPGIGQATASAIVTFAFNMPTVFIETNVRSVFILHFFKCKNHVHDREILPLIARTLDQKNPREWYYALMDYGVMLKKRYPGLNQISKHYIKQTPFVGSHRELRGKILKALLIHPHMTYQKAAQVLGYEKQKVKEVFIEFRKEGFIPYTK